MASVGLYVRKMLLGTVRRMGGGGVATGGLFEGRCKSPGERCQRPGVSEWRCRGGLFESFGTFPKSESSLLKLNQIQFVKKKKDAFDKYKSLLSPLGVIGVG